MEKSFKWVWAHEIKVYKRVWVARQNTWIIQFLLVVLVGRLSLSSTTNHFPPLHKCVWFAQLRMLSVRQVCKISTATSSRNTRRMSWAVSRSRCFNKISSCKNRWWFGQVSTDAFRRKTAWILGKLVGRVHRTRPEMNNATLSSHPNRKKTPQIPLFGEKSFKSYSLTVATTCCMSSYLNATLVLTRFLICKSYRLNPICLRMHLHWIIPRNIFTEVSKLISRINNNYYWLYLKLAVYPIHPAWALPLLSVSQPVLQICLETKHGFFTATKLQKPSPFFSKWVESDL